MKKVLLTAALFGVLSLSKAQSTQQRVKLPDVVNIKLTAQETALFVGKIDSLQMLLNNSNYPAGMVNSFNQRVARDLTPFYKQLNEQLVKVDTAKTATKKKP